MAETPTVVITDRRFPDRDPYRDAIEAAGGELVYGDYESLDEIVEGCRDAAVVVTFKAPITADVIESLDAARLILRNGAGYDNVDIKAANDHNIPVSTLPGYCSPELAEHAIGLMIGAAHEVVYSDADMRSSPGFGQRRDVNPMTGGTFGVMGLGNIGRAVVPMARGLGMDVIAHDPYVPQDVFDALAVESVTFDELLARSDCVSVHCQLTAETHHRFSTAEFEAMKESAVIVNTARGPIIDEAALVDAVESGEIFAAGIDVFETEPPDDTPALACDRIVVSPHHGGTCDRSLDRAIRIGRDEIVRALTGEHLRNVVNPEALKYAGELHSPELGGWL